MDVRIMWALAAAAVVVVAALIWMALQQRRTAGLRRRFGDEYDRALVRYGSRRRAEAELLGRAARVEHLHIRPLAHDDRLRFAGAWQRVQNRFVDDPKGAVTEADRLVGEVMAARGYPLDDFEQRVADISVDHPNVVMNYRAVREIAETRGDLSTEDLRQAMVHYRALFDDLLGTGAIGTMEREHVRDHAEMKP